MFSVGRSSCFLISVSQGTGGKADYFLADGRSVNGQQGESITPAALFPLFCRHTHFLKTVEYYPDRQGISHRDGSKCSRGVNNFARHHLSNGQLSCLSIRPYWLRRVIDSSFFQDGYRCWTIAFSGHAVSWGGSSFLIVCDLLARTLPEHGEIPVGIVTALIGAPLFIFFALEIENMKALKVEGVSLSYGGKKRSRPGIVFGRRGVNFFMILGPNGAGKSSLLKLITGIRRLHAGEISIFGRPKKEYSARELAKVVSLVSQHAPADFPFSVAETVFDGKSSTPWLAAA